MKVMGQNILIDFSEIIARADRYWEVQEIPTGQPPLVVFVLLYDGIPLAEISQEQFEKFRELGVKPEEARSDTWTKLVERSEGICTSLCKLVGVSNLPEARMALLENLRELSDVVRLIANRAKDSEKDGE